MKHEPQIITGEELANRVIDSEEIEDHDYSMVVSDDGEVVDGVSNKWFSVQWPEHCITKQHLGDAWISGPFETGKEAATC